MARLPAWLLRRTVTVEPPATGGGYASGTPVAVAYNEAPAGNVDTPGRQWATVNIVGQLDAPVPVAARVTFDDGRRGIVTAATRRTSGGLPTPDHLEVVVKVPTMVATTTATIWRGTVLTDRGDRAAANTSGTVVAEHVPAAFVLAGRNSAATESGRSYDVEQTAVVFAAGTDVRPGDRAGDDTTGDVYLIVAVDPDPTPGLAGPVQATAELIRD